jgi:hypothetical protein
MHRWARLGTSFFVRAFGRDLDLVSVVDDFGALIYREIDYRAEARNARQFAKLYQGYENTIRVPEIYDELTTSTVRSRRPAVLRCLHAVDATRVHLTMKWVVSCLILSAFRARSRLDLSHTGPDDGVGRRYETRGWGRVSGLYG